ncbi:MAG: GTP-binding protein [Ancrocorticia sp.]
MKASNIPVIALTGYLGAGKTTLLNHLLRAPGARLGVVINDFGAINVDSALVEGQIDEAASIAGGCLCCMPDAGGLDEALRVLSRPKLRLDAIIVEASGVAEPISLARLLGEAMNGRTRFGGVVDVVDAAEYFATVDTRREPPARFAACTLVVVNKVDLLPTEQRAETVRCIKERVHQRNPSAQVVEAMRGSVDPELVFDVAQLEDPEDQLPLGALIRSLSAPDEHVHADSVTVLAAEPVDARALVDLLENPPKGVYRLKGFVRVWQGGGRSGAQRYAINIVGHHVHVERVGASGVGGSGSAGTGGEGTGGGTRGGGQGHGPHTGDSGVNDGLVAIGIHLDRAAVETRIRVALGPAFGARVREDVLQENAPQNDSPQDNAPASGPSEHEMALRKLGRYQRLSG